MLNIILNKERKVSAVIEGEVFARPDQDHQLLFGVSFFLPAGSHPLDSSEAAWFLGSLLSLSAPRQSIWKPTKAKWSSG
jgi:hypothetical protein